MKLTRDYIPRIAVHVCWSEQQLEAYFDNNEKGRGYVPLIEILDDGALFQGDEDRESDVNMLFYALTRIFADDRELLREAVFSLEPRHLDAISAGDVIAVVAEPSSSAFDVHWVEYCAQDSLEDRLSYLRSIL